MAESDPHHIKRYYHTRCVLLGTGTVALSIMTACRIADEGQLLCIQKACATAITLFSEESIL